MCLFKVTSFTLIITSTVFAQNPDTHYSHILLRNLSWHCRHVQLLHDKLHILHSKWELTSSWLWKALHKWQLRIYRNVSNLTGSYRAVIIVTKQSLSSINNCFKQIKKSMKNMNSLENPFEIWKFTETRSQATVTIGIQKE